MRFLHVSVLGLALLLPACATGAAIVTGVQRPAISAADVRLYSTPPAVYEEIALISASSEWGWSDQEEVNYALDDMRRRAAALGANGILIEATGATSGGAAGFYANGVFYAGASSGSEVRGRAIFVPAE